MSAKAKTEEVKAQNSEEQELSEEQLTDTAGGGGDARPTLELVNEPERSESTSTGPGAGKVSLQDFNF